MPMAIKLTESNVYEIIAEAKLIDMDLSHLPDDMEENGVMNFASTYLITDGTVHFNNITFTTLTDVGFHSKWKFTEAESDVFAKIERI